MGFAEREVVPKETCYSHGTESNDYQVVKWDWRRRVAVSSQTSVFYFKKLLDKVEVILNMCYH